MIPKFCPLCGGKLPICVSDDDIKQEVEWHEQNQAQEDCPLTWTRDLLDPSYLYCRKKEDRHG